MIRKAIIVGMTLGAAVIGGLVVGDLSCGEYGDSKTTRFHCEIRNHKATCSYGVFWEELPIGVEYLVQGDDVLDFSWYKCSSWTGPQFSIPAAPKCFDGYLVSTPLWFLFVMLASYPIIAFIRGPLLRWRRKRKGLCLKCGYDLTGNVTGVCSECGNKIAKL